MIDQIAIALTGVVAIFLTQSSNPEHRRYACLFGMASQPFWFYAAWTYVGNRLTVIHEFCGNWEDKHRELRKQIVEQINPLLKLHGADPINVDLVADPDLEDL